MTVFILNVHNYVQVFVSFHLQIIVISYGLMAASSSLDTMFEYCTGHSGAYPDEAESNRRHRQ